jgi:3-oxoacyl-[acyl-carrier protein] reductase
VRSVLVTGGSRGLGLGIARSLASSGFQVIAIARSESEQLTTAMAEVAGAGRGTLHFHACDLSDLAGLPLMVKAVRSAHGPIYGLVNNAGIGTPGVLANMKDADIERLVNLNTTAPMMLTKYVIRTMLSAGDGRIVNISSVVGLTGYSGLSVYSATKASLLGFTRSLAREVGQLGITVNAVAPGFVDTEMTHGVGAPERDKIKRRSALHRMPEVSDIANMVDYLLSEKARNITGTVMTVDAGNTA